jgi:hypothetical protein
MGAAGYVDVDGEQVVEGAGEVVAGAEEVVAEGAVAEGCDAAGFGHGVGGDEEGLTHSCGDGAGDEQDVGVAG